MNKNNQQIVKYKKLKVASIQQKFLNFDFNFNIIKKFYYFIVKNTFH